MRSKLKLKTNVRNEWVCSMETRGTALTPEQWNTPPLTVWPNGKWADSTGKRTDWKFELSPWTPVPVCVSVASIPSTYGDTGQGNGIQRSAYCSASLRATDYDYHNYQALKVLGKSVGLCKTTKRKDKLYISLLVSVWRIICENFNPNGLILAEIWMKIETKKIKRILVLERRYSNALTPLS